MFPYKSTKHKHYFHIKDKVVKHKDIKYLQGNKDNVTKQSGGTFCAWKTFL